MLEKYTCENIGTITACNGNTPIYLIEYKGEKIAFYLTGIGAAVASATCYEVHWQTGATKFIMFSSCGSLDAEATTGKFILVLEEGSNPDIKEKLINGQVDVALVIGRVAATGFIEEEIDSKSMCAVVPKGHSFFERESLKIADLKGQPLISLNEKYQSYANLLDSCEREGFYPDVRIKTMEAAMIYEFVREGLGIGIDVDIHNKEDDKKLQQFATILTSK